MTLKEFCDRCNRQVGEKTEAGVNVISQRPKLHVELWEFEVILGEQPKGMSGVSWNSGSLCLRCFKELVARLPVRVELRKK